MSTEAKPIVIEFGPRRIFYKCPKCKAIVRFTKKYLGSNSCKECGQKFNWLPTMDICSETLITEDADEAAWIANQYYKANQTPEDQRIDIDEWRCDLRQTPVELYLLFKDRKKLGKFMREYAKEGTIHDG